MEHRARLQARIKSLGELREVVGMMRALASNHLHEAQQALAGIRGYVEVVEKALVQAGSLFPRGVMAAANDGDEVLIVVTSEHGFAGAFNDTLMEAAQQALKPHQALGVIGRRGALLAQERNMPLAWSFAMATHVAGVQGVTRRVADHLEGVRTADILYAVHTGGGSFKVTQQSILPLAPALLSGNGNGTAPPLHHLPPEILVERLAGEYLFAEINRAVMESMASENGVRLMVMESANHSTERKLEDLQRQDQRVRQEEITTELLDVVVGANALSDPG
jgi:F-type H+-transporting ATPase subunit gamma